MPTTYGTIQTMARAFTQICEGTDPWIAQSSVKPPRYAAFFYSECPMAKEYQRKAKQRNGSITCLCST
jgi:hypothetical protein